jgi:ATP-dependent exoDNAse (exonuclease V) alpha subunit
LCITRNANKQNDFVNGMGCEVLERDPYGVLVRTDTGKRLLVHPMTDPETKSVYFPLRHGYATTLHKVQGATLEHMTMWLDKPWWPAAAYVALSRVQYDSSWRFVGDMKPKHFVPAEL